MNELEKRVDLRIMDPERIEEGRRTTELLFRLHETMPMTDEYRKILRDLFGEEGEGSPPDRKEKDYDDQQRTH